MRILAAIALLLVFGCPASTAWATNHWVSASGTATWAAATSSSTPTSLDTANVRAVSGDNTYLLAGSYAGKAINPSNSGTSGSRIVFMGSATDTSAAKGLGSPTFTTSYVTIKYMSGSGGLAVGHSAAKDSLYACTLNASSGELHINGDDFTLAACRVTGSTLHTWSDYSLSYPAIPTFVMRPIITDNVLNLHTNSDNNHVTKFLFTRFARLERNNITLTIDTTATNSNGHTIYFSPGFVSKDNKFTASNHGGSGCDAVVIIRDSTYGCQFTRDSIIVPQGSRGDHTDIRFAANGSVSAARNTGHNRFESLFIKNFATDAVHYQDMPSADTIQNCVFASGTGAGFVLNDDSGATIGPQDLVFRHNTLFGTGSMVMYLKTKYVGTGNSYRSNVAYSISAPSCISYAATARVGALTSSEVDSNLVFSSAGGADSANAIHVEGGTCSSPQGFAGASAWRTPFLTDSSYANLNAVLQSGSWAVNTRWADDYVGARLGPSWPVKDLAVSQYGKTTEVVAWTQPHRIESLTATFDLRRSTSNITDMSGFNSAFQVGTGTAAAPGGSQCVSVTQLDPCTTYYYAVVITDAAGSSSLSNVPSRQTRCSTNLEVSCGGMHARFVGDEARIVKVPGVIRRADWTGGIIQVSFAASDQGKAYSAELFDVGGRRMEELASGVAGGGETVRFAPGGGPSVPYGVHYLRIRIGLETITRTLVVVP